MGKFKIGDKVRVIDADGGGKLGDVCTVMDLGDDGYIVLDGLTGGAYGLYDHRLELVEQPWQPKVGDRVSWREVFVSSFYTKGKVYEIRRSDGGGLFLTDDERNAETGNHQWGASEIATHFDLVPVTLTLEAGKFYKTRDGRKVGPVTVSSDGDTAWDGSDNGYATVFTNTGRANYEGDHPDDYVAEWIDEPAVAASNDNAAPAKFKVGDRVRALVNWGNIKAGKVYTVPYLDADGEVWFTPNGAGGWNDYLSDCELELVVETTPAIVALIEDGQPKPATRPKIHADQSEATAEAERLALAYPGQEFGVFVLADSKIADIVTTQTAVLRAA
ncbi:hypothetical protein [Rhizobium leguminosarum]|uniref:hypothetical protein n=1 Tax=Rhizobium leguminosarum TaxID=384 RepID=UPI0015DB9D18|nr:hypothetical protein [Rhizobium leguminosarum]NZD50502.1 hypothetical protein [Rhizobium leguminosarum]